MSKKITKGRFHPDIRKPPWNPWESFWISGATLGEWAERAWRKLDCRSTVDRAHIYAHRRAVICAAAFVVYSETPTSTQSLTPLLDPSIVWPRMAYIQITNVSEAFGGVPFLPETDCSRFPAYVLC